MMVVHVSTGDCIIGSVVQPLVPYLRMGWGTKPIRPSMLISPMLFIVYGMALAYRLALAALPVERPLGRLHVERPCGRA